MESEWINPQTVQPAQTKITKVQQGFVHVRSLGKSTRFKDWIGSLSELIRNDADIEVNNQLLKQLSVSITSVGGVTLEKHPSNYFEKNFWPSKNFEVSKAKHTITP